MWFYPFLHQQLMISYSVTYFRTNSINMVRHVYNNNATYQWLNVETRERLHLVICTVMCEEQWPPRHAQTFKMLGPWVLAELFSKPVFLCGLVIFWVLLKSGLIFSLVLSNFKFLFEVPGFKGFPLIFTVFRTGPSWPRGRYLTGRMCLNGFLYSWHH